MTTDPSGAEYLGLIAARMEAANKQVEAARRGLEQAERASRFWSEIGAHLRHQHPAQALFLLRREADYVNQLVLGGDPAAEQLRSLRSDLHQQARGAAHAFGREFPPAAREAGLQIDSVSRHPKYSFKQGFLHLDVDDREFTARIAPRDGEPTIVGLDLPVVVDCLKRETQRLFGRQLEPEAFLGSLYRAYAAVLRAEGRREGDELPLRRVTNRLAKNLNHFAADEFNVDLATLIRAGNVMIDGRRLHLNHTRNQRQGMLLYGLESGGYVGFISFKPEGQS